MSSIIFKKILMFCPVPAGQKAPSYIISNRLIWLLSGRFPKIPSDDNISVMALPAFARCLKSSFDKKGPCFAAS